MEQITLATLNVAAPSKQRGRRLLDEWILGSSYDIYVFTETSESDGTDLITSSFKSAGWKVFQRPGVPGDRGVTIATRIKAESPQYPVDDPLPGRSIIINLEAHPLVQLVAMYVPNRGNDGLKIERKRSFLDSWLQYLAQKAPTNQQRVLVGDLNVVPTSQHPVFLPQHVFENRWYEQLQSHAGLYDAALMHHHRHESTWVAHTGEGYTYDHIMPAKGLCDRVVAFAYDHSPRLSTNVSDHSALILTMNFDSVAYLHRNPPTELKQMDLL